VSTPQTTSHDLRRRLLLALLDESIIGNLALDGIAPDRVALVLALDDVKPGERRTNVVRNHTTFRLERLVILETEYEARERTETTSIEAEAQNWQTVTTSGRFWWKKKHITVTNVSPVVRRTCVETKVIRVAHPTAWTLGGLFGGCENAMPFISNEVPGGALLPAQEALPLRSMVLHAGHDITFIVEHKLLDTASFRALVIGHRVLE
jgi:hypothetical protein